MHHHNTILGQMLKMFSRYEFQKAVSETKTELHSRGFSSWNHFVAMLFGQLAGQDSLRGIEAGLATQASSLYHLGVTPVRRSTLSYANEHRTYELFQKLFYGRCCLNARRLRQSMYYALKTHSTALMPQ